MCARGAVASISFDQSSPGARHSAIAGSRHILESRAMSERQVPGIAPHGSVTGASASRICRDWSSDSCRRRAAIRSAGRISTVRVARIWRFCAECARTSRLTVLSAPRLRPSFRVCNDSFARCHREIRLGRAHRAAQPYRVLMSPGAARARCWGACAACYLCGQVGRSAESIRSRVLERQPRPQCPFDASRVLRTASRLRGRPRA